MSDNINFPNVNGLTIVVTGVQLFPRDGSFDKETVGFTNLVIEEDMFAESIIGSIEFVDNSLSLSDKLFVDSDVQISFDSKTYNFRVIDIDVTSDLASKAIVGPDNRPTKIKIRFASRLFANVNYDKFFTENFIGKISIKDEDRSKITYLPEYEDLKKAQAFVEDGTELDGFLQTQIAPLLDKPLNADSTFNDIWFKPNPVHYPYSKLSSPLRVSQLMNYITEYACDINNKYAVNFFFWEDLDSWNFRSIQSLVAEQENEKLLYFTPTTDENAKDAVVSIDVVSAVTPAKLREGGAFSSEYIRVKPDWGYTYGYFMDANRSFKKTKINYDYGFGKIKNISKDPVRRFDQNSNTTRMTDKLYGYYSDPYHQDPPPWWNYYDNYNKYETTEQLKTEPDRTEKDFWQAQFDFCELPGDYLNIIKKKIKWRPALIEYRKKYAEQKALKQKWEIYKKSVCCVRDIPQTFFALLTKANKRYGGTGVTFDYTETQGISGSSVFDSGGIWQYEWTEVEFWPRADADKIPAPPIDPETGNPKPWSQYSIIEFEDNSFPFVFVKPKGFMRGYEPDDPTLPDNRAYNLNEILNSRAPVEWDYAEDENGPFTLLMNPGLSDALGFTGDRADKGTLTSYPVKFKMMPVGKFKIIDSPCSADWNEDGTFSNQDFYQAGRIVQMFRIPKETLSNIQGATVVDVVIFDDEGLPVPDTREGVSNIFVFDVENAHDGLCVDC